MELRRFPTPIFAPVLALVLQFLVSPASAEDKVVEVPERFSLSEVGDEDRAAKLLDGFLRSIDANDSGITEVRFPQGLFCTDGVASVWHKNHAVKAGFRLKSGWRFKGAGMNSDDGTVLRLVSLNIEQKRMIVCSSPYIDETRLDVDPSNILLRNTSVEDIVIDCNYEGIAKKYPDNKDCVLSAIRMYGQNLAVRRVMVINAASKMKPERENFIINLKGVWMNNSPGHCYVGDSVVTNYAGGYTSAIHIAGIRSNEKYGDATGVIERCKVFLPGERVNFGLNCGGDTINVTFRENEIHGAGRGINNDTGLNVNLRIINNKLENCAVGMYLMATHYGVCQGNEIHLAADMNKSAYGIAVVPYLPGVSPGAANWVIDNNTIHGNFKRKGLVDFGVCVATRPSMFEGKRNKEWFWAANCSLKDNRFIGHGSGKYKYLSNLVHDGTHGAEVSGNNVNQDGSPFQKWDD